MSTVAGDGPAAAYMQSRVCAQPLPRSGMDARLRHWAKRAQPAEVPAGIQSAYSSAAKPFDGSARAWNLETMSGATQGSTDGDSSPAEGAPTQLEQLFHANVSVQRRGVIALPSALRERYLLDEPGAQVEVTERPDGVIELRPTVPVAATDAWFWSQQ